MRIKWVGLFFSVSIIFCLPFHVSAQKVIYGVHMGGKEIGQITASLTKTDTTQTYQVFSDVKFKVLWKNYHRTTTHHVIYENEFLKTSLSNVSMNNELEDSARMNFNQDAYDCYRYPDKEYSADHGEINYTTARLYFDEPVGIKNIYSERFLAFCPLESLGDHKYKLYLTNGKENYYTYSDGILTEVFVDRTWFNLTFRQK